ncbi:MAG: hypothetical protein QW598_06205 [Pyrobaculum sp.]
MSLLEILNMFAKQQDPYSILFKAITRLVELDMPRPRLVDALASSLPQSRRTTPIVVAESLYSFIESVKLQNLADSFRRFYEIYAAKVLNCDIATAGSYTEVRKAVETALRGRHDADVEDVAQAYAIANHMLNTGLNSAKVHSPDAKFSQAIRLVNEAFPKFAQLSLQHVHCNRS